MTTNSDENDNRCSSIRQNQNTEHEVMLPKAPFLSGDKPTAPSTTTTSSSSSSSLLRQQLGCLLIRFSDLMNDNLIVVRYATFSTVLLLGVYGVANTPLFYRYKHVLEIPPQMYYKRKWIHGRIVAVVTESNGRMGNDGTLLNPSSSRESLSLQRSLAITTTSPQRSNSNDKHGSIIPHHDTHRPIVVLFRHFSPMERLLSQSSSSLGIQKIFSIPQILQSTTLASHSQHPYRNNLLPIELAGISSPPPPPPPPSNPIDNTNTSILSTSLTSISRTKTTCSPFPFLDQLIQNNNPITLQLLAPRTRSITDPCEQQQQHMIIGHLHYRTYNKPFFWFQSIHNISLELIEKGEAWMNPNASWIPPPPLPLIDDTHSTTTRSAMKQRTISYTPTVQQLTEDTQFIYNLERMEYISWKSKVGMWSDEDIRKLRTEYLAEEKKEEERRASSSVPTMGRIWNFVKRGWEWLLRKSSKNKEL